MFVPGACPPQTIILEPVHTAVWIELAGGAPAVLVSVQVPWATTEAGHVVRTIPIASGVIRSFAPPRRVAQHQDHYNSGVKNRRLLFRVPGGVSRRTTGRLTWRQGRVATAGRPPGARLGGEVNAQRLVKAWATVSSRHLRLLSSPRQAGGGISHGVGSPPSSGAASQLPGIRPEDPLAVSHRPSPSTEETTEVSPTQPRGPLGLREAEATLRQKATLPVCRPSGPSPLRLLLGFPLDRARAARYGSRSMLMGPPNSP